MQKVDKIANKKSGTETYNIVFYCTLNAILTLISNLQGEHCFLLKKIHKNL